MLAGKTPAQVQAIIGKTPGWKVEKLRQGSRKGEGWVFRQYNDKGKLTEKVETGELSQDQFEPLKALELQLDQMSDVEQDWNDESLIGGNEWEKARRLAASSLKQFDWMLQRR